MSDLKHLPTTFVSLSPPMPSATNVCFADEKVDELIASHRAEGWPVTDLRPKARVVLIHPREGAVREGGERKGAA